METLQVRMSNLKLEGGTIYIYKRNKITKNGFVIRAMTNRQLQIMEPFLSILKHPNCCHRLGI